MIKVDIVKRVAEVLKIKDKEALTVVDSIIDSMKEIIQTHGRLEIRDFGVFQVRERKQRIGRNPRNKKEYPIPPRKVVTFKLGKELKYNAVDKSESPNQMAPTSVTPGSPPVADDTSTGSN